jgi:signal transduction histidine kinase
VDLDTASGWERDQSEQMAFEVEQFTELAQLGITVELISHELERLDHTIGEHLTAFPIEIQKTDHFHAVSDAHHELVERLRFLSPLKLSGASRTRTRITGQMIAQYVQKFFASGFKNDAITFAATPAFLGVVLEEYRSRIFPVFINLITNARYWVCQNKGDRKIRLDFIDGMVIVADSGPGIPEKDQEHLFELFFTRRISGRGVGLYLCKTNLARGNHTIRYAHEKKLRPLSGASFAITFEGLANEF